jgi:hypothetical protein
MARGFRFAGVALGSLFGLCSATGDARAAECALEATSVRVMFHEPEVLTARIATLGDAGDAPAPRRAAFRKLFEAAGCTQISEQGDSESSKNVECTALGTGSGVIVVGVSQKQDSIGSAALLASLAESLAVAPRKHTFRWVAFSQSAKHGGKPKGAMRLLRALTEGERRQIRAMVHIGPLGFGPPRGHPGGADDRLRCALDTAAGTLGTTVLFGNTQERVKARRCFAPGYSVALECPQNQQIDWSGAKDWEPFRRAGIPVLGIHSGHPEMLSADLDGEVYYHTYRLLSIALALVDDALAP